MANQKATNAAERPMTPQAVPAKGSSFYAAMRILPEKHRAAIFCVYAFCRAVDDIVDEEGTRDEKRAGLDRWRKNLDALFAGHPPAQLDELNRVIRSYDLKRADFLAVIDGMAMDAEADIRAPSWDVLDLYCDRVASAVGRLCTPIFGLPNEIGIPLAHHLGRALQLTNILRDIDEDATIGRLYLPAEALSAAGIDSIEPSAVIADPRVSVACKAVADRARAHFDDAHRIMKAAPRAAVKTPRLMEIAYRSILKKMVASEFAYPRPRFKPDRLRLISAYLWYALI